MVLYLLQEEMKGVGFSTLPGVAKRRCFCKGFSAKLWRLKESHVDLNAYYVDNLFGSLIGYEQGVNQRNLDACEKKKEKIMALKANNMDIDSSGFESNDVAFIIRQFKSFLMKNNKKLGYVKANCPTLKEYPSKEKVEEKITNLCLMGDHISQSDQEEANSYKRSHESIWYLDSGCSRHMTGDAN
ncbi:hypothetical protein KFK09_000431 [Dendrobium nobile]|uniref:Uncharacterized protein n=1 Tax=Dendrobium nobile TaxID=94219 RepID=A0A8T3CEP6_DENNO|nr:hypothetical protein KFK09_000431 [Dendrobium nobile]